MKNQAKEDRRRFVANTGIRSWGIPVGIGWAILTTAESRGLTWESLLSVDFLQNLIVGLLVVGLLGGWIWGRLMWWTFMHHRDEEEE